MKKHVNARYWARWVGAAATMGLLYHLLVVWFDPRMDGLAMVVAIAAAALVLGFGWFSRALRPPLLVCAGSYTNASGSETVPLAVVAASRDDLQAELRDELARLAGVAAEALEYTAGPVITQRPRQLVELSPRQLMELLPRRPVDLSLMAEKVAAGTARVSFIVYERR